ALRVAGGGLALLRGAGGVGDDESAVAAAELRLDDAHRAQAGQLADMEAAGDAIYGRVGAGGRAAA
ncbi:acyl-CoA dehydrogenase, partial [Candidatus Binatia bacterium]|nr:acyl-CoA dehydrogenase [Candidatus Binatia bacterium]